MPELEDPFAGWNSNKSSEWDLSGLDQDELSSNVVMVLLLKFPHDVTMARSFWGMLASGSSAMTDSLKDRLNM